MPLDAQGDWTDDQVRHPGRDRRRRSTRVYPLEPVGGRGAEPAERFRYRDGARRGRRDRQRDPRVLRLVRPRAAHGRGPAAQLPVRARRARPARRRCGPVPTTTSWPRSSPRRCAAKWAGHADRPGAVHPAAAEHEPDRRLTADGSPVEAASAGRHCGRVRPRPTLPSHVRSRPHPPRPARPGPHGRRHAQGPDAPAGHRPGQVFMQPETTSLVARGAITKGDVLAVARVAGIQAAKRAPDLIPLCHPLLVGLGVRQLPHRGHLHRGRGPGRDRRPHRRRDGGAHRLLGRRPHHLRHVQVGRPLDGDRRRRPVGEDRRPLGHLPADPPTPTTLGST